MKVRFVFVGKREICGSASLVCDTNPVIESGFQLDKSIIPSESKDHIKVHLMSDGQLIRVAMEESDLHSGGNKAEFDQNSSWHHHAYESSKSKAQGDAQMKPPKSLKP